MELMGGLSSPGARYWRSLNAQAQIVLLEAYKKHNIGIDWLLFHCDYNGRRLPNTQPTTQKEDSKWRSLNSPPPSQESQEPSEV